MRELRVLLEAVADPEDDAALLELCETRWARTDPRRRRSGRQWTQTVWGAGWRLSGALGGPAGRVRRRAAASGATTWTVLRRRLHGAARMLRDVPVLAWVVELARAFEPEAYAVPGEDDAERVRYGRCLDHLITLIDAQFQGRRDHPGAAAVLAAAAGGDQPQRGRARRRDRRQGGRADGAQGQGARVRPGGGADTSTAFGPP